MHTRASPPGLDFFDRSAACARSVRDLMPVAEMKECSCLPALLKSLIKLSTWRTFACVPTLTKDSVIGHFRVPKTLTFKMRPSVQPFSWKWVLFAWEWKIISISKAEHLTSFLYRGPGNSEIKWPIANYKPWITFIKMPTKLPMTLCNIRS